MATWVDHIASVGIYPPIGIARVGNSTESAIDDGWYYGPEVPGRYNEPPGGFKDATGAVKRQAARFRVFAFDANKTVLGEVNATNGFSLDWTLRVANKKASWFAFMGREQTGAFQTGFTTLRNPDVQPNLPPEQRDKLIVDSGVQTVNQVNQAPVPLAGKFCGSKETPTDIYLGEARSDEEGRLVVLAGRGLSFSIATEGIKYPLILTDFDSPDWIDDTSDGWVSVQVTHTSTQKRFIPPVRARVIGTTPKFANGIYAPTTLYDVMEEIYEQPKRAAKGSAYDVGAVSWYKDIWPLLERPPLLSWVNGQANGGHGPNGPGNFYDPKWQEVLSDPTDENKPQRKGILGRMRLPETNSRYDKARAGQAFPYFMPWLSGDGGRATPGDPTTFSSVTELQYDRLVKWSDGAFTATTSCACGSLCKCAPHEDIDDIPLQDRPAQLTKASLEATIGAPLYPGIELSWNAELPETYNLAYPFTINENLKEGDLTKYLSLPWQSDFYMCRSYWWPSARPDAIVSEVDYNRLQKAFQPSDLSKGLTKRVPWERGIHQNYTDTYGDQPLFANTDMAKNWHKLGFVVKKPSIGPDPIFVEVQRQDPHSEEEKKPEALPHFRNKYRLVFPSPPPDSKPIDTLESLKQHLQAAIAVELSTIPLYLFAMYSIKTPEKYVNDPRYYDPTVGAIRGVIAEEMLHLSLAGNILRAIGGTPRVYDVVPKYPAPMLGHSPKLELNLRGLSAKQLETFLAVELPAQKDAYPEADKYQTLGQFYKAIEEGLEHLNETIPDLFDPTTAGFQFAPGLGYQAKIRDAGGSVIVTDIDSAKIAVRYIVDQGEGFETGDEFADPDQLEKAHFYVFKDLLDQISSDPTAWETYPVRKNPNTIDYYYEDHKIYHVSLAFDAAYCFLLKTIEKLWYVEQSDDRHQLVLGNMFGVMMGVLPPLAKFLAQQPIGNKGEHAAAAFNYYYFEPSRSALAQLQEEMDAAINAYVGVTEETPNQVPVHDYGAILESLLPIKATVDGLLDLDSFQKLPTAPLKKFYAGNVQSRGANGFGPYTRAALGRR